MSALLCASTAFRGTASHREVGRNSDERRLADEHDEWLRERVAQAAGERMVLH